MCRIHCLAYVIHCTNDGSKISMGVIHLTDVTKILCKDKFLVPSQPVKISTLTISVWFNVVT